MVSQLLHRLALVFGQRVKLASQEKLENFTSNIEGHLPNEEGCQEGLVGER
jgi:hypothetical protein